LVANVQVVDGSHGFQLYNDPLFLGPSLGSLPLSLPEKKNIK